MLCGIRVEFNLLGDVFALVSCQRHSYGFQSAEALGHFQHSGGRPAQRHRGIPPTLRVATDATHCPQLQRFNKRLYDVSRTRYGG
jgi:hypothetical protein